MKKLISVLLVLTFLAGCSVMPEEKKTTPAEICAVWIYFDELSMKSEKGGSAESFERKIDKMLSVCAEKGINTLFFHVRPFCDAMYRSAIFPWSAYLTGTQGKSVDYDPLEIALRKAHERGMTLHAWINPFRIAVSEDISKLSADNPALRWIKEKSPDVVNVNGGWYFCPASVKAQKTVIDGVREIVENYDVDGIHIDDYFYPSADKKVDKYFYDKYKNDGGKLGLSEWRLNVVSAFVSELYAAAKSVSGNCIFSISPAGNIVNNYTQLFADVRLWCSRRGYADWIIPQLYYGFEDEKLSFDLACGVWSKLPLADGVKMIYGIAAYKINNSDSEWDDGRGIIEKQLSCAKAKENYCGAAFFSYSSLADKNNSSELENLGSRVLCESPSDSE